MKVLTRFHPEVEITRRGVSMGATHFQNHGRFGRNVMASTGLGSKMRNIASGSSILTGDATTPGVPIPDDVKKMIPIIDKKMRDFGCSYPPFVVQMCNYDEISEIAAYGGFPARFSHWSFGMEYEQLAKGYMFGNQKIYEMVINTWPLYIYCLVSNPLVDHVTVIAHALGHGDFFMNNLFFKPTSQNMMNDLASHGTRIQKYMNRWGGDVVGSWLDKMLSIDDLIDPHNTWRPRKCSQPVMFDKREYDHEARLPVEHDYMEGFINPEAYIRRQREQIARKEARQQAGVFEGKTRNVMGFLKEHAPMQVWQRDIMGMIQAEAEYFSPQRYTKTANEGWASYIDYEMMARQGLAGCEGIVDYAMHKAGVLGGKYSLNPYALGFKLFLEIEERWNKGKHGDAYENTHGMKERADYDTKAMGGHDKVFEVRAKYNDYLMISEFFDREFAEKYEFFEWQTMQNGDIEIASREFRNVKDHLLARYRNGGLPDIRLADPDHRGKGVFLLEHQWDGRTVHPSDTAETLACIQAVWKRPVALTTENGEGQEIVYVCEGGTNPVEVKVVTREDFEEMRF